MSAEKYEVIFCIVNVGFTDRVMEEARKHGATGGTVINAHGTANPEAEKVFGIAIEPEKEIVMILVDAKRKDEIMHALYTSVGLNTPGGGIAYSMPVSEVCGLNSPQKQAKPKSEEQKPAATEKNNGENSASKE